MSADHGFTANDKEDVLVGLWDARMWHKLATAAGVREQMKRIQLSGGRRDEFESTVIKVMACWIKAGWGMWQERNKLCQSVYKERSKQKQQQQPRQQQQQVHAAQAPASAPSPSALTPSAWRTHTQHTRTSHARTT